MMNSGIVCGRQMSARASSAAAWLVAIQKTAARQSDGSLINSYYFFLRKSGTTRVVGSTLLLSLEGVFLNKSLLKVAVGATEGVA